MERIYLDNSATTRMCQAALEAYTAAATGTYGNPSSLHTLGVEAEGVMERARNRVMASIGARDGLLVFTSGGTESNNLAITGRARAKERFRGGTILTTAGEHSSVSRVLERLAMEGFRIAEIPTHGGVLDLAALEKVADERVILATFMLVNNETGAVYDLPGAAAILRRQSPGALLHCDATQAYLKVPFTAKSLGADLLTLSSHKIEGPKGVGALWVSAAAVKNKGLSPLLLGGGQEQGLRSGTENVSGIAAFGAAADMGHANASERIARMRSLHDHLLAALATRPALETVVPKLPPVSAPHIVNLTLPGIRSETMLHHLSGRGIYVSSGSACSSHARHTSSALLAFGCTQAEADCSIRVSFCPENTEAEVDALCDALADGVTTLARKR